PQIHGMQRLDSIIQSKSFEGHQKFIPSTHAREIHFKTAIEQAKETLVLIGPEGGFSEKEINDAISAGFLNVTLGPNRLRTETAGIVVCSIFANS
ncbi:MAG: RsmE family RNA methyltransferase, partial [Bacteroidia bacterium]|nr:RsmE family RNA methyltransferase [Bacteroidia bacterium]